MTVFTISGGFGQSISISNRVPVALAHLDLQIKIFLLFPLFVLMLQQLKLKLVLRVI